MRAIDRSLISITGQSESDAGRKGRAVANDRRRRVPKVTKRTFPDRQLEMRMSLILVFTHPDWAPERISDELGLEPTNVLLKGEMHPFKSRGINSVNSWIHVGEIRDTRYFFRELMKAVSRICDEHAEFYQSLRKSGGALRIEIMLNGRDNFGDNLSGDDIMKISDLGIEFGVEVYPQMADDY